MKRGLTEIDVQQAFSMIENGQSVRSVARFLKVSRTTLRNRLIVQYGQSAIPLNVPKLDEESVKDAFNRIVRGWSLRRAARFYRVDKSSLRDRIISEYGLTAYQKAVRRVGTLASVCDYSSKAKGRYKAELDHWIENNFDVLASLPDDDDFFSDRKLRSIEARSIPFDERWHRRVHAC